MTPTRRTLATVLYEDSRGTHEFGLHEFIAACLFDAVNGLQHEVAAAIEGRPLNGDSRVLEGLTDDFERIAPDGRIVCALLDGDRIRSRLQLPEDASEESVRESILRKCPDKSRARVYFISRNLESLLRSLPECGLPVDGRKLELAVKRKGHNERDLLFASASRRDNRAVRGCIMDKFPGVKALVDQLEQLARADVPSVRAWNPRRG